MEGEITLSEMDPQNHGPFNYLIVGGPYVTTQTKNTRGLQQIMLTSMKTLLDIGSNQGTQTQAIFYGNRVNTFPGGPIITRENLQTAQNTILSRPHFYLHDKSGYKIVNPSIVPYNRTHMTPVLNFIREQSMKNITNNGHPTMVVHVDYQLIDQYVLSYWNQIKEIGNTTPTAFLFLRIPPPGVMKIDIPLYRLHYHINHAYENGQLPFIIGAYDIALQDTQREEILRRNLESIFLNSPKGTNPNDPNHNNEPYFAFARRQGLIPKLDDISGRIIIS
ncbi:hypothetical protein KC726_05935 [Candidatus Woesebacteria bacterium]|nr:hypothetical protein [Candidatus Woesebacteria bacterium]